LAFDHSKLII